MRSAILSFTVLTVFAAAPAMAQMQQGYTEPVQGSVPLTGEIPAPPSHQPLSLHPTNLNPQTTRSVISPSLPQPPVGGNADATQYLQAAQNALSRNQTGETQAALEDAETYLLNRSVPQGAVNNPDQSPAIHNIDAALQALAANDRGRTMDLIQQTIPMTQQYASGAGNAMGNGYAENTGQQPGMNGYSGANGYGYGAPPPR